MSEIQQENERLTKSKAQARAVSRGLPQSVVSTVEDRKLRRKAKAKGRHDDDIVVEDFSSATMDDAKPGSSGEQDMRKEIQRLKEELIAANNTVQRVRKREKELSERLA